jgi:hypothetical protein
LQLHLEPSKPIEVSELTGALAALARQYQSFAVQNHLAKRPSEARLLVQSVAPGSIDISLYPDLAAYLAAAPMLALVEKAELIAKFGKTLKALFELFKKRKAHPLAEDISVKDCEDVINIAKPIANNGGTQTFNTINGGVVINNIFTMSAAEASLITTAAIEQKALLQSSNAEVKERVPMVWKRLDRDETRPEAKTTPDRALIEEVDPKSHPVFFTDEMSAIKKQMITDYEANPYQTVIIRPSCN